MAKRPDPYGKTWLRFLAALDEIAPRRKKAA